MLFGYGRHRSVEEVMGHESPDCAEELIWKVCHNLFLTNGNLFIKSIGGNPFCPFYLVEEETVPYFVVLPVFSGCLERE
jgi:hypothetical protein